MKKLGQITITFILMILEFSINGLVIMKLWGWFISTTFEVNQLTFLQSIGVSIFVNWMLLRKPQIGEKIDNFSLQLITAFVYLLIMATFFLLIGFLFKTILI